MRDKDKKIKTAGYNPPPRNEDRPEKPTPPPPPLKRKSDLQTGCSK